MALDPNIALGVRPIEIANPLAQYGQVAAIQNAQNQNQLAQYQLGAAQRAEAKDIARTNMLAQAGTDDTAIANALLKAGDIKGYQEFVKSRRETQKADVDLVDAKLKQSRLFLDTINPADPAAPAQYLAWHKANHADPILGPALAARGVTADQSMARIQQAIQAGPQAFADLINQSKLGTEKFMELNKPHYVNQDTGAGGRTLAFPGLGGASTVAPNSEFTKTMTFADKVAQRNADIAAGRLAVEQKRLAQDATSVVYQTDANGNVVALPSRLKAGEVPTGRTAVAPGGGFQPMMAKPSEVEGREQMSINQQKAIVKGALDAVAQTPDAFGYMVGSVPESARARMASSDENTNRSYLFNVVSGVIKERAGTAQSASEAQTLARFLPVETDNADIITDKLKGFEKYLNDKEAGTTKKRSGTNAPPLAPVDQQALQWANSNPADPRAVAIKQRLGQ